MKRIRVSVTPEDIAEATRSYQALFCDRPTCCPIATALKRQGHKEPRIVPEASYDCESEVDGQCLMLTKKAARFATDFDYAIDCRDRKVPAPATFVLTLA